MPLKKKSQESQPNSIVNEELETFALLSEVKSEKIRWLWYPYIAYGMMTILEGDPGLGKTFVTLALAAVVSKGGHLPGGGKVLRGNVLIINGEDDPAYTIRPRVDAQGGDASRIRYMSNYVAFDPEGLEKLRIEIETHQPDLIIVDPLFSYIPEAADMHKANKIRPFLTKLGQLAKLNPSALIVLRHLRKSGGGDKQLYAGSGSIDVIAVARSALVVFENPEVENQRVLAHLKYNLSPEGCSWLFKIEEDSETNTPRLLWEGKSDLRAADAGGRSEKTDSSLEDAKDFLSRELAPGPKSATALEERAALFSISKRTLDRAKAELEILSKKLKDRWVWHLKEALAEEKE